MSISTNNTIKSTVPRRQVGKGRNNYLFQHAGSLLQQGGNEDTIYEALRSINQEDCTPPVEAEEVAEITCTILKRAQKKSSRRSNEGGAA